MAVNLTRLLVLFSVFCWLAGTAGTVDLAKVKTWASNVGGNLSDFFNNATSFEKLQEAYNRQTPQLSVRKRNGTTIVNDMKIHLQDVLQKKIKSIKKLAEKTAGLRKDYSYESPLKEVQYYNSKDIDALPDLRIDPRFSPLIEINRNNSVVHIPTDVYSGGIKILNTIKWTDGMDRYFKENDDEDPTLLWQYFGSSDGVYRVYPGFKWPDESENDVFDSRRRGWYIQGSSSPKDIVLLLDLSGSMAGQKLSIVKLAAMSLLETLQENDFVNIVIVYKNDDKSNNNEVQPYMVCQVQKGGSVEEKVANCSDKLLQATQQNKKYLKSFVPNIKAHGIAAVSNGFKKAIDVLRESEKKSPHTASHSSGCTQAIILFTDGIEDNQAKKTSDMLKDLNYDKKIRVFTYLVGREKSTTDKPLKEISSEYKGCSFRIKTLSDVREKVLEYVKVLSRPLGFAIADTGPDPSWTPIYLDKLGLGLMITLVAPVFNKTGTKGELLGVVGTDVALPQLEASIPSSEVGVNGYGFAINNNGFVLFHPDLDKTKDPPNIALYELEYNATDTRKLMKEMIDRKTGNMMFQNRLISEHKHRLSRSDEFHYFYSPVENTSFSAAVAIPNKSLYVIDVPNSTPLDKEFLQSSDMNESVILAPWKFCPNISVAAENETPVYLTAYPTAEDIIQDTDLNKTCVDQKSKNLFFDANLTKEAAAKSWNATDNLKNGIESVFVATHGGVMRWLNSSVLASPPKRDYIKEEFYTQAAQYADKGEKQIIVFSAPYRAPNYQADVNETASITASSAVVVLKNANMVVAAVAGMHVKQDKLTKLVLDSIGRDECNDTTECAIRLIDDDGFVVASNQDDVSEVGKFFGVMEGLVTRDFLNRSLFEALTFTSVQEECEKSKNTDQSSARTLLNPLFAVTAYVQFWTQTVFWSLAQFNIYSFFSQGGVAMADEEEKDKMIQCTKQLKFYKAHGEGQVFDVPCENSEGCSWQVYMAPVNGTNLRLVVVKKGCTCNVDQRPTTTLTSDPPLPGIVSYRKAPEFQPPCNDSEEGKPPCALASLTSPHSVTTIILLVLAVFVNNWR